MKSPNSSRQEILEQYRGIRRVVINTKHGGFGLSPEGCVRYLELCGQQAWVEEDDSKWSRLSGPKIWLLPPGPDRVNYDYEIEEWSKMSLTERQAHNKLCDEQVFNDRDIPRDDPYLVKVVDEMGAKANGKFADLKVVDIPADVEWEICEYDGNEWVAEKHRTWS